jgi:hypothetical protein
MDSLTECLIMLNPYDASNANDRRVESHCGWVMAVARYVWSYLLLVMSATVFLAGFLLAFVGVATHLDPLTTLLGAGMGVLGLAGTLVAWRQSNRGGSANGTTPPTNWPIEGAIEHVRLNR